MDNGADSYRRYLDGEQEAFGEIVDLYRENLIFFIHRYVNNLDTAEDLAEDVFVELIVHPGRFEGKSSLKTFVFAIARNKAIDWLRKHTRMTLVPVSDFSMKYIYVTHAENDENENVLWDDDNEENTVWYIIE